MASLVDATQLVKLARKLEGAPPRLSRDVRGRFRAIGRIVGDAARDEAGWSSRIPDTVKVRVTANAIVIEAGGPDAPHAALAELRGTWRHPLFGDKEHWYSETKPKFLTPAYEKSQAEVGEEMVRAIETTLHDLGF